MFCQYRRVISFAETIDWERALPACVEGCTVSLRMLSLVNRMVGGLSFFVKDFGSKTVSPLAVPKYIIPSLLLAEAR